MAFSSTDNTINVFIDDRHVTYLKSAQTFLGVSSHGASVSHRWDIISPGRVDGRRLSHHNSKI